MTASVLQTKPRKETVATGLSAKARKDIAAALGEVLANTMILQMKTQVFHWNVTGPMFYPLHQLSEVHYNNLFVAADVIAERIRALGHLAPLSTQALKALADLKEETGHRSAEQMVGQLVDDHEMLIRDARKAADHADEASDFVTNDLLTERLAFHEKAVWMLRAIIA